MQAGTDAREPQEKPHEARTVAQRAHGDDRHNGQDQQPAPGHAAEPISSLLTGERSADRCLSGLISSFREMAQNPDQAGDDKDGQEEATHGPQDAAAKLPPELELVAKIPFQFTKNSG